MKILSLDQASLLGFAVFDDGKLIKYGLADFNKITPFAKRISEIKSTVIDMLEKYKPNVVSLEDIQYQGNADTFKKLAQLLGVLENLLIEEGYAYEIISPSEWRSICGVKGKKRGDLKLNAKLFISSTYGISVGEDEADAIAQGYAICTKFYLNIP